MKPASSSRKGKKKADETLAPLPANPVVGLALGSGSARGWAHIGVILELEEMGIHPQVVAGTSVGALVGAIYVSGEIKKLADWVQTLNVREVVRLLDITFTGGMMRGEKLFGYFEQHHSNRDIRKLKQRFASVATEMHTGREIWLTEGPVLSAARASCALPGVFAPVKHDGRWMLDGGLVNPVPVSVCRALGADVVIAVNLNAQLVGAHFSRAGLAEAEEVEKTKSVAERGFWQKMAGYLSSGDRENPGFFDVVAASVNILQDRLTRSRMAGDPSEVTLVPHLEDFALMDFHRAGEAIEAGRAAVRAQAPLIRAWTHTKASA
ncbi:MAG: patatin-like phospholipase RssA [Stagnimonas sp.]|nr:patatin-like phospholipase RssA [Stagnimonas sp.]